MSSFIDWLIDMTIWEQATDALGLAENDFDEAAASQIFPTPQKEAISQPNANNNESKEGSNE